MLAPTILIIDDSESASRAARTALATCVEGYQIEVASNGLDGFKRMVTGAVDLVLCDLMMEGFDGFKFLGLKRSRPDLTEVPVIMLTGAGAVTEKVKALEGGASDYLTKPFEDAELIARVRVHLKLRALQNELREKNRKLEELSNTDDLTKLANRRHFMEVASIEFLRALRYERPLSCILLDLDHFKRINDTYGHLAGDAVLRTVSQTLRNGLRGQDIAARYGGEELILILPETSPEGAEAVAQRYRRAIRELAIEHEGQIVKVSASFGVASYPSNSADTLEHLVRAADAALYQAKELGRDCVVVASN